ncbi:MAG TPA: peptidoglycan DD-metalloendopeptidase family protein [Marmoricola sp.]|nr:peptidoglycan DD-metalloendopeptidase family protein [Marmoricola sp.]
MPLPPRDRFSRTVKRNSALTLALLAAVALASGPTVFSADAVSLHSSLIKTDDLHNKKNKVHQGIQSAQGDLEDSSASANAANARLKSAQASLGTAQATFAATQGQLSAAQVLDTQMQAKLAAAQTALDTAQTAVANGKAHVVDQRAAIGRLAAESYTYGDPNLMRMSIMLQGATPEQMALELSTIDSLMSRETGALARLKATEATLVSQKDQVAKAKTAVAQERQDAAVNLAHKQQLEQQAAAARSQVAALVASRQVAVVAAAQARASDLAKLKQLKKQEARIQRLIKARARKHQGRGFTGSSNGYLLPPVKNSYITSPYGWRIHPIYHYWGLHDGDDFHAPCGVPEYASAGGTVISEYYSDVWGNRLYIDAGKVNGKSMTLIYNHISTYKAHTGDHVKRGDVVAYAGTTGWSTGCHLHFTVMINGTAVDPQTYM